MAEGGFRVLGDVVFDLLPVPLVISNLYAGGANGQKPAQLAYLVNGSLESIDQLLATLLQLHYWHNYLLDRKFFAYPHNRGLLQKKFYISSYFRYYTGKILHSTIHPIGK